MGIRVFLKSRILMILLSFQHNDDEPSTTINLVIFNNYKPQLMIGRYFFVTRK